ncbi:MAG: citrate/2-methylcitrate synthase [Thermoplasmata archaeon]
MEIAKGLAGIVIDESRNSFVDGEKGLLVYQGYDIHDLAKNSTFEETVYLLWNGYLPTKHQLDDFSKRLAEHRPLPEGLLDCMSHWPKKAHPMDVLRTAVSSLGNMGGQKEAPSKEEQIETSLDLTAGFASILASWVRIRSGKEPVEPDMDLAHAGNFLWMMRGEKPNPTAERVMDMALVLHADHGFNASTFSGRVTASTLSDVYSAVVAAIGTLKGPLHGGANMRVMEMLKEIGSPEKAEQYILDKLAKKERIMGFGHRVYKTMDPRAEELSKVVKDLGEAAGDTRWYDISQVIETVMMREKGLNPNVDFYSASTYYVLGIPIDLYTPIFALSRIAGWSAHIMEQLADNKLIRPRAKYIGPMDLEYVPIGDREEPAQLASA